MGSNMALRLQEIGFSIVSVFDHRREAAREVAARTGAVVAETLAEVTAGANVIFTVVGTDREMESLFRESGDSLLQNAGGRIFINCATVSPGLHVEIERRSRARNADSLEASMASSIPQARSGTLYLMVGGKKEVLERVRPVLDALSAEIRYVGPAGQAAKLKALVNMVMNINTAGLAEGLGLADALGLDLAMVREVFSRTGPLPGFWKPMAPTCRTGSTTCIFPPLTPPKTPISPWIWPGRPVFPFLWPGPRPDSSTGWWRRVWARSTSRGCPS